MAGTSVQIPQEGSGEVEDAAVRVARKQGLRLRVSDGSPWWHWYSIRDGLLELSWSEETGFWTDGERTGHCEWPREAFEAFVRSR